MKYSDVYGKNTERDSTVLFAQHLLVDVRNDLAQFHAKHRQRSMSMTVEDEDGGMTTHRTQLPQPLATRLRRSALNTQRADAFGGPARAIIARSHSVSYSYSWGDSPIRRHACLCIGRAA